MLLHGEGVDLDLDQLAAHPVQCKRPPPIILISDDPEGDREGLRCNTVVADVCPPASPNGCCMPACGRSGRCAQCSARSIEGRLDELKRATTCCCPPPPTHRPMPADGLHISVKQRVCRHLRATARMTWRSSP